MEKLTDERLQEITSGACLCSGCNTEIFDEARAMAEELLELREVLINAAKLIVGERKSEP